MLPALEKGNVPKFVSSVFLVKDVARSKAFYVDLLGQRVMMDYGRCVNFEGGLTLWQEDYAWEVVFGRDVPQTIHQGNVKVEIAFEIPDLESLWKRLVEAGVHVAHPVREQPWGQRVGRVYDPDGHLVEFGEPLWVFVRRFAAQGLTPAEISTRTSIPLPAIEEILAAK